jgi:hypothetical protein
MALHPTIPDAFGLDASISGLLFLDALTLYNGRTMEIFLAMSKSEPYSLDMALEAHRATARKHIKGEDIATFGTVDSAHHR